MISLAPMPSKMKAARRSKLPGIRLYGEFWSKPWAVKPTPKYFCGGRPRKRHSPPGSPVRV